MTDDSTGTAPVAVSPNNPCPFLRGLVANGYVGGHIVPLPKLSGTIAAASGEAGLKETMVQFETWMSRSAPTASVRCGC